MAASPARFTATSENTVLPGQQKVWLAPEPPDPQAAPIMRGDAYIQTAPAV